MDEDFVISDISQLSLDVPPHIQRAIGNSIISFARLEHTFELMIWDFLKLSSDDGKLITARMEMSRKTELVKELIATHAPASLVKPVWQAVTNATEARNKVAHAVWIMATGQPAMVSSRWASQSGNIAVERFRYERLVALARLSTRLEKIFKDYSKQIGLRQQESVEQWHGVFQTRTPNLS